MSDSLFRSATNYRVSPTGGPYCLHLCFFRVAASHLSRVSADDVYCTCLLPLQSWQQIKLFVGKLGRDSLQRRIAYFNIDRLQMDVALRVMELLAEFSNDDVYAVSECAAVFHTWVSGDLGAVAITVASVPRVRILNYVIFLPMVELNLRSGMRPGRLGDFQRPRFKSGGCARIEKNNRSPWLPIVFDLKFLPTPHRLLSSRDRAHPRS